jgi:hypothetical protein
MGTLEQCEQLRFRFVKVDFGHPLSFVNVADPVNLSASVRASPALCPLGAQCRR